MYIIKRDGSQAVFDPEKIRCAIQGANNEVLEKNPYGGMSDTFIAFAVDEVVRTVSEGVYGNHAVSVEDVQDVVENTLIRYNAALVAKAYITYRHEHAQRRQSNTTDDGILALIECNNEEVKQENSNKNPTIVSVQRDYMAGEVSKDLSRRILLPEDVVKAHDEGEIHFHDMDYYSQHMHNCCLINLGDMLQNGTVISETRIDPPKSFTTACTVASQLIAQVSSSQYGGQSITLSHLAPFVDVSRKKIRKNIMEEFEKDGIETTENQIDAFVESRVRKEVASGVQTIQYQVVTIMTTNGQAPFITVFMYLDEVPEGQTRDDLALIIEEMLKQRILGVKNEKGVYITPAFPKLIYVLDEDNINEGTKYYYLTELAARCTAKRMVPDYISAKKMRELKVDVAGNRVVYPCMGCVDGQEVITYRHHRNVYVESFERMWKRLSDYYPVKIQPNGRDLYMDTDGVEIYDQKSGFVKNMRVIRNLSENWLNVKFNNGRVLHCTPDHPFETENRGIVYAKDLTDSDVVSIDHEPCYQGNLWFNRDRAWMLGLLLCDSTYYDNIVVSIAATGEDEIEETFRRIMRKEYGLSVNTKIQDRGVRGHYKDLAVVSDYNGDLITLKVNLTSMFGGKAKKDRHIPNEVFEWDTGARLAFLAGMIDADGYINDTAKITKAQLGSVNKELALQQMLLAQSLGMHAMVYLSRYRSNCKDNVRYRVEFIPTNELMSYLHCGKKLLHFGNCERTNDSIATKSLASPVAVEETGMAAYSYDVTTETEHFTVSGIWSHNCRSFLTPDRCSYEQGNVANAGNYKEGEPKYYGRFNQGVVTINLVDAACSSGKDEEKFWKILDERLELCHKALRCRHERLKGTPSDVAPILWQHGALARLEKGETIDKLLYGGYSTISLGYAGLYETCMYMKGKSHTDPEAKPFALAVMQKLNDKCAEWKAAENIDYSVYGTPLESTTYKFAKCLQKRFGIIENVTDHNYISNSYHVNVREQIDAFTKLKFESEFQELSPGGAISYVEVPNMQDNIPAVIAVMQYIYDNIMYAELNTKSDYCDVCGYDGEIQIIEDEHKKLIWECPNCGNRDQNKMNVARRTCGYIGSQFWNQGRTQEIRDRVLHL